MHQNAQNYNSNRHQILRCYADFCSLPPRAGTGLHCAALVRSQQNKFAAVHRKTYRKSAGRPFYDPEYVQQVVRKLP